MTKVTRTIKLKFVNLNRCKAQMFELMTAENTRIANELLSLPLQQRRKMTTAKIATELRSALVNQTIRLLDGLLKGNIEGGSAKLIKHKNKWYVYLSVTEDVPEVPTKNRLGCDRGQNNLAVIAGKKGFGKFFRGREVMHRRRYFQRRRKQLQQAKKFRALKKWDKKERRWMESVNHTISRRIVRFAEAHKADVVVEDLKGCRDTMKQRKKSRSDSGQSRHSWSFSSLESKLNYKLAQKGLRVKTVKGRIGSVQLSLFDCTYNGTRSENHTALTKCSDSETSGAV